MSDSVGEIGLDLGLNYSAFNNQLKGIAGNAENLVGSAFKKLGKIAAIAFSAKAMFDFGKGAIGLASDLSEVQNVVDVTFGSMAEDINNFSKSALEQFGMSELSAKKFSSTMGAMLKSSGLAGEQMLEMSKGVAGLTGDMASFYNLKHDEAFNKIRAGIAGEVEPLRQLGINMSVANMEAFALSQGINKSWSAMSQAEQTLLRYNYLMGATSDAQGDFARTSDSWANQTRLLSEQWKIFQQTMGQGFINILTPVIKMLNTLISQLQVAAQYFKAFTDMIFGVQSSAGSAASTVADMGSAATGMGDDVKKAGKAVKGSIMGFDELNTLADSTAESMEDISSSAAAGVDVGGTDVSVTGDTTVLDPIKEKVDGITTSLQGLGTKLNEVFGPSFNTVLEGLNPVLENWKNTLLSTFNNFSSLGTPLKSWFINELPDFINQGILTAGNVLTGLLDIGNTVFSGVMEAGMPLIKWFIEEGLLGVTVFGTEWLKVFNNLFDNTKSTFDKMWAEGVQPGLNLLSDMTLDVLNEIKDWWGTWGGDIRDKSIEATNGIFEVFNNFWDSIFKPNIDTALNTIKTIWDTHFKDVRTAFGTFLGTLTTGALTLISGFIKPVVNDLINTWAPTWNWVFDNSYKIFEEFFGLVSDITVELINALTGITNFLVGVFTKDWDRAWNGIGEVFKSVWGMIKIFFKDIINEMIGMVNDLIEGLNKIHFDFPDWVPNIGGKSFGINIPKIPMLAKGGIINQPTLAMVGEKGREAVVPLEDTSFADSIATALANALMAAMSVNNSNNSSNGSEGQELVLQLDSTSFARLILPAMRKEAARTGVTVLQGV